VDHYEREFMFFLLFLCLCWTTTRRRILVRVLVLGDYRL